MTTLMRREIDEIPAAVARLSGDAAQEALRRVGHDLRERAPPVLLTVARGSSHHAATYLKYAVEMVLRLPVASVGPSVETLYAAAPKASAALAISQSGTSPDLVALSGALQRQGAHVVALTNAPGSPLARAAGGVVDIAAGPEHAVAATKSYVASLVAGLWIVAHWAGDDALTRALRALPEALDGPVPESDAAGAWHAAAEALQGAGNAVVIARGPALGLAQEMALKLIETCAIHASAYSAAEVLHGPSALLTDRFPVLVIDTGTALADPMARLVEQGARVLPLPAAADPEVAHPLVAPEVAHPLVAPLLAMPPFYRMVETLSRARGGNPDAPRFLSKETSTV